jgi:hypothetical protein
VKRWSFESDDWEDAWKYKRIYNLGAIEHVYVAKEIDLQRMIYCFLSLVAAFLWLGFVNAFPLIFWFIIVLYFVPNLIQALPHTRIRPVCRSGRILYSLPIPSSIAIYNKDIVKRVHFEITSVMGSKS